MHVDRDDRGAAGCQDSAGGRGVGGRGCPGSTDLDSVHTPLALQAHKSNLCFMAQQGTKAKKHLQPAEGFFYRGALRGASAD